MSRHEDWFTLRKTHKWMWISLAAISWIVGLLAGLGVFSVYVNVFNFLALASLAVTLYTLGKPLKKKETP